MNVIEVVGEFTDGGWSAWSSWGKCSVMCGTGITDRQRSCDNPVPSQFGKPCKGDAKSSKLCHSSSCSGRDWF